MLEQLVQAGGRHAEAAEYGVRTERRVGQTHLTADKRALLGRIRALVESDEDLSGRVRTMLSMGALQSADPGVLASA